MDVGNSPRGNCRTRRSKSTASALPSRCRERRDCSMNFHGKRFIAASILALGFKLSVACNDAHAIELINRLLGTQAKTQCDCKACNRGDKTGNKSCQCSRTAHGRNMGHGVARSCNCTTGHPGLSPTKSRCSKESGLGVSSVKSQCAKKLDYGLLSVLEWVAAPRGCNTCNCGCKH